MFRKWCDIQTSFAVSFYEEHVDINEVEGSEQTYHATFFRSPCTSAHML